MKTFEETNTTATHEADDDDRVLFHVPDPDYHERWNRVEVYISPSGRLEIASEVTIAVFPEAANVVAVQPQRKRR